MRWHILAWAREQKTGSPGKKALIMSLAEYADEHGYCYPSQERLAEETEQSVRTVRNLLCELEEMGLIRRERRHNPHSGLRDSDGYWLELPAGFAGKDSSYRQPDAIVTGNGLPGNSQYNNQSVSVNTNTHAHEAFTPSFVDAWAVYPKRAGTNSRRAAEKAWNARIKEKVDPNVMFDGTLRYSVFCDDKGSTGTEYVMQASRFYGSDRHFESAWESPYSKPVPPKVHAAQPKGNEESYLGTVVKPVWLE